MSRMILVPIDISDKEFTQRVIRHVESEARVDDAQVHFLTVIPSLPYYASWAWPIPLNCRLWMNYALNRKRNCAN